MEMVAGVGGVASDLLLRALRLCQYHSPRYGDVYAVSDCHLSGRGAAVSRSAFAGVFLESGGLTDSLRHYARPHLLRRRLYYPANLVVDRPDYLASHHIDLESRGFYVVEGARTLVIV